jgi:MFS family permease
VSSESFFEVLKRKKSLLVAVLSFFFGIGLAAANSFVTPFATERFISYISLYYVAYSFAAILTRLFGGRLADSLGEEKIIPYALVTMSAGLFITVFITGNWILLIAGFLTGAGHGFLYPSLNAFALRGELPNTRGKITGVFTGSIDGGSFFGAILLGYVGVWSGFQALFITAGSCVLLGFLVFPFTRKWKSKRPGTDGGAV